MHRITAAERGAGHNFLEHVDDVYAQEAFPPSRGTNAVDENYFEWQDGAWCGMHAVNNYVGGPYVDKQMCRNAARMVVANLSQALGGDVEDMTAHLDPKTGFLSIDVINVLGAGALGLHVEGNTVYWEELQREPVAAALVNWNNHHWTVLRCEHDGDTWTHINSIVGRSPHKGRKTGVTAEGVATLLGLIRNESGGVSLHRITAAERGAAHHFLEPEGRRAMLDPEVDVAVDAGVPDAPGSAASNGLFGDTLRLVTLNVAGCQGSFAITDDARIDKILDSIFERDPRWEVNALLFQEVTEDMYAVIRRRLASWSIYGRRDNDEGYFVVTAVRYPPAGPEDKSSSYAFPAHMSVNDRRVLTVRRGQWAIENVHLDAGGRAGDVEKRLQQFGDLCRTYERYANQTCVLAGDFNVREGEDQCLLTEDWRDAKNVVKPLRCRKPQQDWTWKLWNHTARYDRVYIHSHAAVQTECVFYHVHDVVREGKLTDHAAVCVELLCQQPALPVDTSAAAFARSAGTAAIVHNDAPKGPQKHEQQPEDVRVIAVANEVLEAVRKFRTIAFACLDFSAGPSTMSLAADDSVVDWEAVPTACGFKVERPGACFVFAGNPAV